MADPSSMDFDAYRKLAQQAWETWMKAWQPPAGAPSAPFAPFMPFPPPFDLFAGAPSSAPPPPWPPTMPWTWPAAPGQVPPWFAGGGAPAQPSPAPWMAWFESGSAPAKARADYAPLGYTRERQREQQAWLKAVENYFEAFVRHQTLLQQVLLGASERMQKRLEERRARDEPPASQRALYDLWVDAYEDAYAELALSEEFRATSGALANAEMRLRKLQVRQMERLCRELGIPMRSEVDTIGRRLQEVRRAVAALERAQAQRRDEDRAPVAPGRAEAEAAVATGEAERPQPVLAAATLPEKGARKARGGSRAK